MRLPRWAANAVLVCSFLVLLWGFFVLSFVSEPSAVGRMHTALVVIGAGCIALGLGGGAAAIWMLVRHRT